MNLNYNNNQAMINTTAIICVYNEEKTIKEVVSIVFNYLFDEVIGFCTNHSSENES